MVGEGVPTTGARVGADEGLPVGAGETLGAGDGCAEGGVVGAPDGLADKDGALEGAIEEDGTSEEKQ